jgi:hypothetical protein
MVGIVILYHSTHEHVETVGGGGEKGKEESPEREG